MKYFLTYMLLTLSIVSYGQCNVDQLGGSYTYSGDLEVDAYISTDTTDHLIFILDFYDKPDTTFIGKLDGISRYTVDFNVNTTKSYRVRRVICYAKLNDAFLLKTKRNPDRVKWIYIDREAIVIKHKHNLFKKCKVSYLAK